MLSGRGRFRTHFGLLPHPSRTRGRMEQSLRRLSCRPHQASPSDAWRTRLEGGALVTVIALTWLVAGIFMFAALDRGTFVGKSLRRALIEGPARVLSRGPLRTFVALVVFFGLIAFAVAAPEMVAIMGMTDLSLYLDLVVLTFFVRTFDRLGPHLARPQRPLSGLTVASSYGLLASTGARPEPYAFGGLVVRQLRTRATHQARGRSPSSARQAPPPSRGRRTSRCASSGRAARGRSGRRGRRSPRAPVEAPSRGCCRRAARAG
jgi:hypothetical protein